MMPASFKKLLKDNYRDHINLLNLRVIGQNEQKVYWTLLFLKKIDMGHSETVVCSLEHNCPYVQVNLGLSIRLCTGSIYK